MVQCSHCHITMLDLIATLVVDLSDQKLTVLDTQENIVRVIPVSTGKASTPTPTGHASVITKYRSVTMRGRNYVAPGVPYAMCITANELICMHGAPWQRMPASRSGARSNGCVRMPTARPDGCLRTPARARSDHPGLKLSPRAGPRDAPALDWLADPAAREEGQPMATHPHDRRARPTANSPPSPVVFCGGKAHRCDSPRTAAALSAAACVLAESTGSELPTPAGWPRLQALQGMQRSRAPAFAARPTTDHFHRTAAGIPDTPRQLSNKTVTETICKHSFQKRPAQRP